MKRAFSLWEGRFPETVAIGKIEYVINPDFRNILKIFRLLGDEEILSAHKYELLRRFFYTGSELPPMLESVSAFAEFVSCAPGAGESEVKNERRFDFEFDAPEIYQSFYSYYGVDLIEENFLHFYKFLLLLSGLGHNTPFIEKLRFRFLDLKGYKGAELARMSALKQQAQLPEKYSKEELAELEKFEKIIGGL